MKEGRTRLIERWRRHRPTDCGPNLRCQRKSPFGIIQLRFAPIIGVANIDGIRIQFGQIFDPHWKTQFQGNEYRERLQEARAQSEEIVQRARQTADAHEHESKERGQEILAEAAKRAERDIEAATKRALDDIRKEVADLTIMATEKVTRKTLNEADQKRLVEEALSELDFSSISSGAANN